MAIFLSKSRARLSVYEGIRLMERLASLRLTGLRLFLTTIKLLETERVLRSRYKLDKASIIDAFGKLLGTLGVIHEDEQALEDALSL